MIEQLTPKGNGLRMRDGCLLGKPVPVRRSAALLLVLGC